MKYEWECPACGCKDRTEGPECYVKEYVPNCPHCNTSMNEISFKPEVRPEDDESNHCFHRRGK